MGRHFVDREDWLYRESNSRIATAGRSRIMHGLSIVEARALERNNLECRTSVLGDGPVVSVTSHGSRVGTVHLALESISRGSAKPCRLVLWLNDAEVVANPPATLRRLQDRGLDIRCCSNYGPHTKYYPALEAWPLESLVTADDDIIYPPGWLAGLAGALRAMPDAVHAYRAKLIKTGDGWVRPYATWPVYTRSDAAENAFATGVSGVIYPLPVLEWLRSQGDRFATLCPTADDIWLHRAAHDSRTRIRLIDGVSRHFAIVPSSQKASRLALSNVLGHQNDAQFERVYPRSGQYAWLQTH